MKTVLITGSTRGIGRTMAMEFALAGYTVIVNGTHKNKNSTDFIKEIKKISPKSGIYYFDVSKSRVVEKQTKKIIIRYKHIDILINNAGILRDKTLIKMSDEDWDKVIKTNLYGPFYVTKYLLPSMIESKWGRIINLSSIIGKLGNFGQCNYAAAKAGLIGFTKSVAKEVAKYNITVNAVCPGLVETEILESIPKEYLDKMLDKIPLRRLAKKEEISKLITFLASANSQYINGAIIDINGGWY